MKLFSVLADVIFSPWEIAAVYLIRFWPVVLIAAVVIVTAVIIHRRRKK